MKEKRTERINIRLTIDEKKMIIEKAKLAGYTLSGYIQKIVSEKKICSKTDTQTVLELKRIGVNINQIAKFVNTYNIEDNVSYAVNNLKSYLNELNNIIVKLT
jgi:uncharacterized protein (DUF1778 family)